MDNQTLATLITKALGYNENGGKPDLANPSEGKSGEMKSIFQYTPATWKAYTKQIIGKDVPLNNDTETFVTAHKANKWLQEGYTPEQIFSMWNAGPGEPDAYTGKFSDGSPSSGKNKFGVKYDVKGYVDKGMNYLKKFEKEGFGGEQQGEEPQQEEAPALADSQPQKSSGMPGLLPSAGKRGPQVAGALAGPKVATV